MGILSYQVSEPMKVSIKIYRPHTSFDTAGNPSPPEAQSLVKRIIGECQVKARDILTKNKALLDQLAERLVEKEIVDADELNTIFAAAPAAA